MDINYKAIGSRIRALRKKEKITQEELALRLDASPSYISHIERGDKKPSLKKLMAIADVFGVTVDEFLYGPSQIDQAKRNIQEMLEGYSDHDKEVLIGFLTKAIKSS